MPTAWFQLVDPWIVSQFFALTAEDAETVLSIAAGYDRNDPYSRPLPPAKAAASTYRIGVPAREESGDSRPWYPLSYRAKERLASLGHTSDRDRHPAVPADGPASVRGSMGS